MKKYYLLLLLLTLTHLAFSQDKPDALKLYREGKFTDAITICQEELKELPRNMDSYTVMGWSLLSLKRYEEAFQKAKKALEMAPFDQRIIAIAGESLYNLGKNRDALWYFELYSSIAPTGDRIADIFYFMGEIYIRLGEYNNADIAFSTALHFDNRDAGRWSRLGYAREMGEEFQWAKEAYQNALKLNPNLIEAVRGLESVNKKLSGG